MGEPVSVSGLEKGLYVIKVNNNVFNFVPTADVLNYYVLIMEPSQFEEQFNMFAPMLGFKNHGDMVKGFGAAFGCEETDFAWDELKPNTDYRIYVQAVDVSEIYSDAFMVQAETTYVAVAVGQNAKGEWGAFTEYEFTTGPTPEKTPVVRVGKGAVRHRTLAVKPSLFEQGKGFALDVNGANQNKGLIEK